MVNQDKMYFVSFENDLEAKKIEFTIWRYDFATMKKQPIATKSEDMLIKTGLDEPHYACQAMLSFYILGEGEAEIDEEKFLEKTFVTV